MSNKLYNEYMTIKYGGNKMVRFQSMYVGGKESNAVIIDGVRRFNCEQHLGFTGGWNLFTLDGNKIKHFDTLAEVEDYVEEMDK